MCSSAANAGMRATKPRRAGANSRDEHGSKHARRLFELACARASDRGVRDPCQTLRGHAHSSFEALEFARRIVTATQSQSQPGATKTQDRGGGTTITRQSHDNHTTIEGRNRTQIIRSARKQPACSPACASSSALSDIRGCSTYKQTELQLREEQSRARTTDACSRHRSAA